MLISDWSSDVCSSPVLLARVDVLNPDDEPGRLSLIHRMGAAHIADRLPPLLDAIRRDGRRVLWVCDPMHGNTEATSNGYKTRRLGNIRSEIEQAFDIHATAGTRLGGVHLELTGEDATECTGGARPADAAAACLGRAPRCAETRGQPESDTSPAAAETTAAVSGRRWASTARPARAWGAGTGVWPAKTSRNGPAARATCATVASSAPTAPASIRA